MKTNILQKTILGIGCISAIGFTACVDDSYDLNNVDMTVTVGGNLTLPASNTDVITLKKIFDLDDNSIIQADENGNYSLIKSGNPTHTTVQVSPVNIDGSDIQIEKADCRLNFPYEPSVAGAMATEQPFHEVTSFNISKNDVTADLVQLNNAYFTMDSQLLLSLTDDTNVEELVIRKGFQMIFPEYMTLATTDTDICEIRDSHILTFTTDVPVSRTSGQSFDLRIAYMDFSGHPDQGLVSPGNFSISDQITVDGEATISTASFDGGNSVSLSLVSGIEIRNISLTQVNAVVNPQVSLSIDPITIDNLPDFLQDDEVRIHMTDPRILFKVTNESPADINFMGTMTGIKNGTAISTVSLGSDTDNSGRILIPAHATDYVICIHQSADATGIQADSYVTVPNLNDIIEQIPDEIRIEDITATAIQQPVDIEIGKDFQVDSRYEFNAPLQFNEGSRIIYRDTMDGWAGDIEKLDMSQAEITLEALNKIPLDMTMTVEAIDKQGQPLTDVTAEVTGTIAAGNGDSETSSALTIRLKSENGGLKKLDGLSYRVEAAASSAAQGITLNENQTLQLTNIVLKVTDGITIDMN